MPLVSVTRLRLRSIVFLLPFALRASRITSQAMKTPGCRGTRTRKTRGLAFWTLTVWDDAKSMHSFVANAPHREAIPKLSKWCDEASVAHWTQDSGAMPEWSVATHALVETGRLLRVVRPSDAHMKGQINVT